MPKAPGRAAAAARAGSYVRTRRVAAAAFKATCLELMDRVRETGVEYVVTKHGEPVAVLGPFKPAAKKPLFGSMRGTVLGYDRPFDPIDGEYEIERG